TVTARAEVTLRVCWSTRRRIGVDLIEQRRVVGEVEQTRECVQRSRSAVQIIVVELPAKLTTKLQPVITVHIADHVAKLHCPFRKDSGRCFRLVSAEADAAVPQQTLDLHSRNAEVGCTRRLNLVVSKLREIESRFVQQS